MSGRSYSWVLDEPTTPPGPGPSTGPVPSRGIPAVRQGTIVGGDLFCVDDIDAALTWETDPRVLIEQSVLRRLTTPRGGLFYSRDYGLNVRAWLNAGFTPAMVSGLSSAIKNECEKDDRVESATVRLSFNAQSMRMRIKIELQTGLGPFPLTLDVSDVSVQVLRGEV